MARLCFIRSVTAFECDTFHDLRCADALMTCFQGGLAIMSFSNRSVLQM